MAIIIHLCQNYRIAPQDLRRGVLPVPGVVTADEGNSVTPGAPVSGTRGTTLVTVGVHDRDVSRVK